MIDLICEWKMLATAVDRGLGDYRIKMGREACLLNAALSLMSRALRTLSLA